MKTQSIYSLTAFLTKLIFASILNFVSGRAQFWNCVCLALECSKSILLLAFINKPMGNENKRNDFHEQNWQILSKIGVKTILKNKMTYSLVDLYEYEAASETTFSKNASTVYEWRKNMTIKEHVPLLYHYEVVMPLIGSTQKQKVFTQHITRFSELPPISKPESFLILEQIIEVLPLLYKQFGLFHANIYTVGVNDSGVTKVWINQNLAKNYPEQEDVIKKPSQNLELTIVNNLVRMLKSKVYNSQIKPQYPFSLNFLETLKFIKETRQRFPEYVLPQVYLNRNQFNEIYKLALNQKTEPIIANAFTNLSTQMGKFQQSSAPTAENVVSARGPSSNDIPQPLMKLPYQFQPPVVNNQNAINQPYYQNTNKMNQQLKVYLPRANPRLFNPPIKYSNQPSNPNQEPPNNQRFVIGNQEFGGRVVQGARQQPVSHKPNKSAQMDQKEFVEQSYYINPPPNSSNSFTYSNPPISPAKQRNTFSPTKFFKKGSHEIHELKPKVENIKTNLSSQMNSNRSISLSPAKKRAVKTENKLPPEPQRQKPNWIRPISSSNKQMNKRILSRIVEQDQCRFDSFYLRNVEMRALPTSNEQGFNVEMVESIYVKTNETDEGI